MRSSRRNRGLVPECTPEPTPPNSSDSHFSQDFQIETTLEEEERLRLEEEEENEKSEEEASTKEVEDITSEGKQVDINFSSDESTKSDSSEISVIVIDKDKDSKKSSKHAFKRNEKSSSR